MKADNVYLKGLLGIASFIGTHKFLLLQGATRPGTTDTFAVSPPRTFIIYNDNIDSNGGIAMPDARLFANQVIFTTNISIVSNPKVASFDNIMTQIRLGGVRGPLISRAMGWGQCFGWFSDGANWIAISRNYAT